MYHEGTCECDGHGVCASGTTTCVCSPLYKGTHCDECSFPGADYPECSSAAINALAAGEPTATANDNKLSISVVWGLHSEMESNPDEVNAVQRSYVGTGFDISQPKCQLYVRELCARLRVDASSLGLQPVVHCWADEFADWVESRPGGGEEFPVQSEDFLHKIELFLSSSAGTDFQPDFGFARSLQYGEMHIYRPSWFRVVVYAADMPRYAAGFAALPLFNRLEKVVNYAINRRGTLPPDIGTEAGIRGLSAPPDCLSAPAFQTAELWPRMYTEVTAVNGTAWAILIIGLCAFLTVLLFTASPRVSACVIINITGILTSVLSFFVLAGWSLGIVEAVSISILLGSSVDYSLHVADAYIECCISDDARGNDALDAIETLNFDHQNSSGLDAEPNSLITSDPADKASMRRRRQRLVNEALARVGGPVLHAAITTFLSVISLAFCVVRIFVEFGMIIAASVVCSIMFALLGLPALLVEFGPNSMAHGASSIYRHAMALAWVLMVVVAAVAGLYLADVLCGEVRCGYAQTSLLCCARKHLIMTYQVSHTRIT